MQRILIVLPLFLLTFLVQIPVQASASDIDDLPVLHRHRVKPFAVAARETMLTLWKKSLPRSIRYALAGQ